VNRLESNMLPMSLEPKLAVLLVLSVGALLVAPVQAAEESARVVGVRGSVLVQTPGTEPRLLRFDDAVLAGDKIVTAKGAGVGLLAGEHYVGLDESTTATLGLTGRGAPDVHVLSGRARVLASGDGVAARLGTATLLAANAGSDTDVFAFVEKAGLVSMICPNEGPVQAARGAQALPPDLGGGAVAKRGEPLYLADAAHAPLDLLADPDDYDVAGDPTVRMGEPLPPVALGVPPRPLLDTLIDPLLDDLRDPCDLGCPAAGPPPPVMPPINTSRPGAPPR